MPTTLSDDAALRAARGVLDRVLGDSHGFDLSIIPSQDGLDVFEVEASGGRVSVAGSSPIALCRGAYEYLKDACKWQFSWSTESAPLPLPLPDCPPRRVVCPNRYRFYFSVCTFAYTMAWWRWDRWEREIDWMALHGINMPLSLTGQEKVWQTVFRQFDVGEESIRNHFSGPAYLPWHRMGNLNGRLGPLPQSWIEGQAELQKRILGRELELGMAPIVPGFSGFVPVDFDTRHPEVELFSPTPWAGFEPTKFVDPRSPLFVEMGAAFIDEYLREFGTGHFYLCDTFSEQNPRFAPSEELEYLRATGRSTFNAIQKADPEGVWVTQGWPFYYARDYWSDERLEALLGSVPAARLIVLDLACNEHEVWRDKALVREKGWIYGTLHNYGHTTNLAGDLQGFADRAATALSDPGHGRMLGMGITPEGIDQNPVVYELMTDAMWTTGRIDVPKWLEGYVESRYGQAPAEALRAWRLLLASVYGEPQPPQFEDSWRFRPGDQPPVPAVDKDKVAEAARLLASAADRLSNRDAYRRDLVDVVKTWLGGIADDRLEAPGEFFEVLDDLDRLMTTRPEHRLSTWLNDARSWGETGEERALLEKNARWLITSWGGPYLYDYAIKEWAGLNGDFIRKRWQLHFEGKGGDYLLWETDWANSVAAPKERAPDDPIQVAFELVAKFREAARESPYAHSHRPGRDVAKRTHGAQCLSIGKPVRCSSGGNAAFVTDGSVTKGFWNADPAPQWIEVDLEEEQEVSGLWLFPCFGDGRSYKYFVEVAGQSKIYHRVVDQSQNRTPSTLRGHRHKILSQMARYVRLTMVENSVGLGVQLYELFVYGWQ